MFQYLIDLFFPKTCAGCDALLVSNENTICTLCRHQIPLTNQHLNPENDAFKKFYGRIPIEYASAHLYFRKRGIVQQLIHKLKYKGQETIGTVLGEWYADDLKKNVVLQTASLVVPVPLHKKKLRERGYNQVSTFGKAIAQELDIPFDETILIRKIYSKTQSKKNLIGRTEGITTVFDISTTEKYQGGHFILVDDVITTGSTLEACCLALLKIPRVRISIVCMAIAAS